MKSRIAWKAENKTRKQMKKRLFFLIRVILLIVLMLYVRNITAKLEDMQAMSEEMQTALKRMEVRQYGEPEAVVAVQEKVDYVSNIGIVDVEKPVQRTLEETIQRLGELGQKNPVIEEIYKNSTLYPEALLVALANNPEMADFVAGYPDGNGGIACELTDYEKEQEFPLFLQWDPRWGYQPYGNDRDSVLGLAGCGPTCLSMVLFYMTRDEKLTPDKIAAYSMENGYYVEGTGTAWALMEDVPKLFDIKVTSPKISERTMKSVLDNGGVIICTMGKGDFTVSGHFIVIYGYDDEGFQINDPNCVARSRKRWTFDEMKPQIKNIWMYQK